VLGLAQKQAQNANPKPSGSPSHSSPIGLPQADDAAAGKSIRPDEPVITVRGVCKDRSAQAEANADCKTIVTREQFEKLTAAVATTGQPVPVKGRRQLAQTYVDLLAYEQAARSDAIENSREFQDLMNLIRLRTLAEIHRRNLQERLHTPSAQD